LWSPRGGDEVRLTEGRYAGFYARVIDCNGIEALVAFPDKAEAIAPIESLDLVLRPAPTDTVLEQRIRAEELATRERRDS
jgi:hypothetical protein